MIRGCNVPETLSRLLFMERLHWRLILYVVLGAISVPSISVARAAGEPTAPESQKHIDTPTVFRKVRVGMYENKPKIFTNESGEPSGIFPAILAEIARREQWQLVYVPGSWNEGLDALEKGRIDLMPDVAYTPERDEKYDFHKEPVISGWSEVYARKGKKINNITDLNGLRIAVLKNAIQHKILEQMMKGYELDARFIEADSYDEAFRMTSQDQADVVVSNCFYGGRYHLQYGLERTPIVINPTSFHFATISGANTDLPGAIDRNLREMKSQPGSVYYKALQVGVKQPFRIIIPRYVFMILIGVSGILVFSLLFVWLLRRKVRSATKDLVSLNEELRESEVKYRMLFETAGDAIMLMRDERFVDCNAMTLRMFECDRDQFIHATPYDYSPPTQPDGQSSKTKAREKIRLALAEGPQRFEWTHCRKDGTPFPTEVSLNRLELNGNIILQAIVRDITKRRRAEEEREKLQSQLIQAQKMELVGRLAGGVAHDYNNMLSVILGYTELALAQVDLSSPLHGHLVEVGRAAQHSADITRQLLAFARRQPVEPKALDLNESLARLLKMLQRLIGEDIELTWRPGETVWPIFIDPSQLDQILTNLCTNARDAINGVGNICIETDTISIDESYCHDHDGYLSGDFNVLSVSDDGCGMDREVLDNIFEPFYTTKGLGKGTGLGLATVYGIVKQNNGFIRVSSEPDGGTVFRIYLPRYDGVVSDIGFDGEEEPLQANGETVLLVEDDPTILKLGETMLETLGYRVLGATTPGQARQVAKDHDGEIDLLITDVVMPEMNGRELSDLLRDLYPDIKILFMSGYTADAITYRGVVYKGVNFMQKPFTLKSLSEKTKKALGKTRQWSDDA